MLKEYSYNILHKGHEVQWMKNLSISENYDDRKSVFEWIIKVKSLKYLCVRKDILETGFQHFCCTPWNHSSIMTVQTVTTVLIALELPRARLNLSVGQLIRSDNGFSQPVINLATKERVWLSIVTEFLPNTRWAHFQFFGTHTQFSKSLCQTLFWNPEL